eukprot:scaffold204181_cov37-Tisochrysis_lutea.AAC.1
MALAAAHATAIAGHDFASRDVLVPFHQRDQTPHRNPELENAAGGVYDASKRATVFQRYCHVYKDGELRELLEAVGGSAIVEEYYDTGNWCAVIEKLTASGERVPVHGTPCKTRHTQCKGDERPKGGAASASSTTVFAMEQAIGESGDVEAAVLAHVGAMLRQVEAIAAAGDKTQREAQYDALAAMLEELRPAGAK